MIPKEQQDLCNQILKLKKDYELLTAMQKSVIEAEKALGEKTKQFMSEALKAKEGEALSIYDIIDKSFFAMLNP